MVAVPAGDQSNPLVRQNYENCVKALAVIDWYKYVRHPWTINEELIFNTFKRIVARY